MQILRRKILLEDSIDRGNDSPTYGEITATTFSFKVLLNQSIDDMGLFTDMSFIPSIEGVENPPDYSILIDKLVSSGLTFPFMYGITPTTVATDYEYILRLTGTTQTDYQNFGNSHISGYTTSKAVDVRSYQSSNPYIIDFDTNTEIYVNYSGGVVNSVSRVSQTGETLVYTFDTDISDINIGTTGQTSGLLYTDYSGKTRTVILDGVETNIPLTSINYIGEGWNETNTSLSALTKEEYLFGIISPPIIQSDVFIDRGVTSVMDKHLRLSEIITLDELSRYGNGFYKLNKQ